MPLQMNTHLILMLRIIKIRPGHSSRKREVRSHSFQCQVACTFLLFLCAPVFVTFIVHFEVSTAGSQYRQHTISNDFYSYIHALYCAHLDLNLLQFFVITLWNECKVEGNPSKCHIPLFYLLTTGIKDVGKNCA